MLETNDWIKSESDAKVVTKPWGKEVWLVLNEFYCYKRLYISAGTRSSLHYHNEKHETGFIISGEFELWLENDSGEIEKKNLKAGDFYTVRPNKKHRLLGITDVLIQEVSTPEVDDVVRVEDDSGRGDGRIDSEHQTG